MNKETAGEIRSQLSTLTLELTAARKDVALLERLKSAQGNAQRLEKECTDLTAKLASTIDDEQAAAMDAMYSRFDGISVTVGGNNPSVLHALYTINYKRLQCGFGPKEYVQHTVNGFLALEQDAYNYLIDRHPKAIPAVIMALAPGDPRAAFSRYFMGMKRGYLTPQAA